MSEDERALFTAFTRKLQYFFCTRLNLKERKNEKRKESFPPNPLIKEKKKREKDEKTNERVGDGNLVADEEGSSATRHKGHSALSGTLDARRQAFLEEVKARASDYQPQLLNDFFFYWSEEDPDTGKMRFEKEPTWNTSFRLKRWVKNQYAVATIAAAIRMKRLGKAQAKERMAEQARKDEAALREQERVMREAENEKKKEQAGGLDDVISANPTGILAKVQREAQLAAEAKKKKGKSTTDDGK